jgi:hypothetical protein
MAEFCGARRSGAHRSGAVATGMIGTASSGDPAPSGADGTGALTLSQCTTMSASKRAATPLIRESLNGKRDPKGCPSVKIVEGAAAPSSTSRYGIGSVVGRPNGARSKEWTTRKPSANTDATRAPTIKRTLGNIKPRNERASLPGRARATQARSSPECLAWR